MMNFMGSALEIFNDCCCLPICVLDKDGFLLNTYGYDDELSNQFIDSNILKEIRVNFVNHNPSPTLYCHNYQSFLVVPFIYNVTIKVFFLIGPFDSSENPIDSNLPRLNKSSFKYVSSLLLSVLQDNFSTKLHPCIIRSIEYVHNNYSSHISIDNLCKKLNINKCYFCNLFKKQTGSTFVEFVTLLRIEKSKLLLKTSYSSLTDIALDVGFNTLSYYSTTFKRLTRMTPSEYRASL